MWGLGIFGFGYTVSEEIVGRKLTEVLHNKFAARRRTYGGCGICFCYMGHARTSVGALITRIGFWGFLIIIMVNYPQNPILIIKAPTLT